MVHDLAASQEFYRSLFGWEFEEGPAQLGPYVQAVVDGRPVAGLGEIGQGVRRLVAWLPYIATRDADATAMLIRDCGGTVAVGPLEVDQVGRLGIAADMCGAAFGIWQGGPRKFGPLQGQMGAPCWNELITADASGVGKFYSMVFGYETLPVPGAPADLDYQALHLEGHKVAGIRGVGSDLPHDRGAHWLTYFSVPDVDEALRRITALGGRQLSEPAESSFGRWARVADREGAPFAVLRATRS
ncbi:VOC family protein [Streptomyces specialis]|uniref:VOC family protein n=1 Tax=Streptomyces specialis TaxID=498367 RepID=UPI001F2E2786|nr:VOC family protein [Streptomyces specialis]